MFDRYVAVDWSAAATPKTGSDSIWIADAHTADLSVQLANPPTRTEAARMLDTIVADAVAADKRVLIGVDANLGFPAGTAAAFGLGEDVAPWLAVWSQLEAMVLDDGRNRNNRFEVAGDLNRRARLRGLSAGPFWGVPRTRSIDGLIPTKPSAVGTVSGPSGCQLSEFRAVERVLRSAGYQPKSVWQLLGAGSVGSQTLTIIPWLERLRRDRGDVVDVWPFTSGVRPADRLVVIAEIWPTLFADGFDGVGNRYREVLGSCPVPDAVQVVAVVDAMRQSDEDSTLGDWFQPAVIDAQSVGGAGARRNAAGDGDTIVAEAKIVDEEGWMLAPPSTLGTARRSTAS